MFRFRRRKQQKNDSAFNAALKRTLLYHYACMLFIDNWDYRDKDKSDLAIHLYFLGTVDCSSQMHDLSDTQFVDLASTFFRKIGVTDEYAKMLLTFFLKMHKVPAAMKCVIEGGQHFGKWLNGNKDVPFCSIQTIERFCDNLEFPSSTGHLYVAMERE